MAQLFRHRLLRLRVDEHRLGAAPALRHRLLDKVVPLRQRRGDEDGLARLGPTARREHTLERCARLRRTQRRVDFVHHQRAQRAELQPPAGEEGVHLLHVADDHLRRLRPDPHALPPRRRPVEQGHHQRPVRAACRQPPCDPRHLGG